VPAYQITQSIYSSEPYSHLLEVVSNYCRDHYFVTGEDPEDRLDKTTLLQRWRNRNGTVDASCHAVVYPSRLLYHDLGSGTLVRIENLRSSRSSRRLHDAVQHLFDETPNAITFDSHFYWDEATAWLARDIASKISGVGNQRVLLTLDDEVLGIKSNPTLTLQERFVRLDAETEQSLPAPLSYSVLSGALARSIPETVWSKFSDTAKACLQTGQVAYDSFDGISTIRLETSPAVIAFAKALEDTVVQRLLVPFRAFVQIGHPIPDGGSGRLNRLKSYVTTDSPRSLELGTLAAQLEHMDTSDTSTLPPTGRVYLQFISTLSDPGFLQHELPNALLDVTRTYRNPAAHPELLDFARLHDFAQLLLGEAEARGLLVRVIEATEPVRLR